METLSLKHFIIFFLIILFSINSLSQIRYIDSVFTSVKKTTGVQYGNNTNYLGIPENLLLDIYEPENDTLSKRPLMIWVHGGAFLSGTRENEDVVFYCNEFAKKGYVTASIDYRLGSLPIITEFMGAVIRAIQDMKAAIRFFRENKDFYRIDTSEIICGGTSAGAFTAIHAGYMNENEIPDSINLTETGGLEGNSGNPGFSSEFHLIINCWGAIWDTTWIKPGDIPIVGIHGTSDNTVPCYYGNALGLFPVYGSAIIARVATRLGIPNTLKLFYGADHQLAGGSNEDVKARYDTSVNVISQFVYNVLLSSPILAVKEKLIAKGFILNQNYPNPFNPATTISYHLAVNCGVKLQVFDLLGREVATLVNGEQPEGNYRVLFNIKNLPTGRQNLESGIYFYRLTAGNFIDSKKFILLK
jgi:hypothetical protein